MAIWRKNTNARIATAANGPCYVRSVGEGGKVPKGYVLMELVGNNGDGVERVLVRVAMLKEPCVLALLEMAAQQFGYGQRGVLRVPCSVEHFGEVVCGCRPEMKHHSCASR